MNMYVIHRGGTLSIPSLERIIESCWMEAVVHKCSSQ